ncbi:MAG: nucleotidyl transferase AbiEii/AbiGii toxin family protein [Candidatus Dadabacteria bacterium]|nr:nucleotidyl transferase AbiEii/AbiGii toxin family protein [Candidatus Dadabacteria bacterium]MDE0663104.1 nucleotidyl transferase AbiEii/AbiGii toxin family protein [Candidatus Dadabacteria bacterium]
MRPQSASIQSIVEKDYALGWMLAGIFNHGELTKSWIFKGGTCLKKCYFETYRFSEDLDFTLLLEDHLNEEFLRRIFGEISEWIYQQVGLEFPVNLQSFEIYKNPRGNLSCRAKLSYRGPVSPSSGGLPRIKLDLTADELLVLPPVRIPILHPYSDAPAEGIQVLAYAYEEVFAEKIRALAERTRPRDLYDVINLFRNTKSRPSASVLLHILSRKCEFKGISVPQHGDFDEHQSDLEGGWDMMLEHQLPALPPVSTFWNVLPELFAWLDGGLFPQVPLSYELERGDTIIRERTLNLPLSSNAQSYLEIIRFAASNRLCVDLGYASKTRRIEPYSLRLTKEGNFILHAWNVDSDAHRSYRIDRIEGAKITGQNFSPRYEVELIPTGPITVQETQGSTGFSIRNTVRSISRNYGPIYILECGLCGKKFRRKTSSRTLRKHKTPDGFSCSGRTGYLIDIKY